jgi:hypothetical protein
MSLLKIYGSGQACTYAFSHVCEEAKCKNASLTPPSLKQSRSEMQEGFMDKEFWKAQALENRQFFIESA